MRLIHICIYTCIYKFFHLTDRQSIERGYLSSSSVSQLAKDFCKLCWKPQIEALLGILVSKTTQIKEHYLQVRINDIIVNGHIS